MREYMWHLSMSNNNKKEDKVITDSFIDSIQEEISKENWKRIWEKYGKLISIGVSILLIASIGYNVWQKQDLEDREAISASFTNSQNELAGDRTKTALTGFKEIGKSSKHNYAALAKFEEAAILREKQDKEALSKYKSVFENNKVNKSIKELAYIYYINTALDLMPEEELKIQLPSFIANLSNNYIGKSWDILAKEALAYCYLKQGDNDKAKLVLEQLATTEDVPAGVLERARELVQYLSETESNNSVSEKENNNKNSKISDTDKQKEIKDK